MLLQCCTRPARAGVGDPGALQELCRALQSAPVQQSRPGPLCARPGEEGRPEKAWQQQQQQLQREALPERDPARPVGRGRRCRRRAAASRSARAQPPALAMEAPQGALGAIMPRNVAERKPVAQLQSEVQRERPPPLPSPLRSAPPSPPC